MKKRALSLFLVFVMALGLGVPAFAAEDVFEAEGPVAPVEEPEPLEEPIAPVENVPEEIAVSGYTNEPVEPLAVSEPEDGIYSVTADTGQVFQFVISGPVEDIRQIVHKIVSSDDGSGEILYKIYLDGAYYTGDYSGIKNGLSWEYEYNLIEETSEKRLEFVCFALLTPKNAPVTIQLLNGGMPTVSEEIYYVDGDGEPIDDVSPYLKEKIEFFLPGKAYVVFQPQNAGVVLEISGGGKEFKFSYPARYSFFPLIEMRRMTVKITMRDQVPVVFKRNGTDYDESEGLLKDVPKAFYPEEVFEMRIKRGYALEVVSGAELYGQYEPSGPPYAVYNYPDGPYAHYRFKVVEGAEKVEFNVTEAEPLYTVLFDESKISARRFGYITEHADSMYEIKSGSGAYEYDTGGIIYFNLKDDGLMVSDSDLYEVRGPHNDYDLIIDEEAAIKAGTVEIKTEPAQKIKLSFAGDTGQFSFYTLEGDEKRELKDGDSVLIDRMIYYVPLTEEARQSQYDFALYGGEITRWATSSIDDFGFSISSVESNHAVLEVFHRRPITFHISSEDERHHDSQIAMLYNYGMVRDGSVAMLGRGDRIFADEYEGTHLYVEGLQMEYVEKWASWKRYTLRIPDGVDEVTIALLKEPSPTPIEKWRSPYDTGTGGYGGGGSSAPSPSPTPGTSPSPEPTPTPGPGVTPAPSPVPVPVDPPKTNGGTGWSYDYETGDYYYFVNGEPKANYWANEAAASMWGYWYYVGADGKLATGLQYIENNNGTGWYFLQPSNADGCIGRMLTGWQWLGPEAGMGWFNTAHGGKNGQCTWTENWGDYNAATGLWADGLSHKG